MIYPGNYFMTNVHQSASAQNITNQPTTKYLAASYGSYHHFDQWNQEQDVLNNLNTINHRIINHMWNFGTHWWYNFIWSKIFMTACDINNYKILKEFFKENTRRLAGLSLRANGVPAAYGFHILCMCGDIRTIKLVWKIFKLNNNYPFPHLKTCFKYVCCSQSVETVKFLMSLVDLEQQWLDRGFEEASDIENYEVMLFLLDYISPTYAPTCGHDLAIMINNTKFYHLINIKQAFHFFSIIRRYDNCSYSKKEYIYDALRGNPKLPEIKKIIKASIELLCDEEHLNDYMEMYDNWISSTN